VLSTCFNPPLKFGASCTRWRDRVCCVILGVLVSCVLCYPYKIRHRAEIALEGAINEFAGTDALALVASDVDVDVQQVTRCWSIIHYLRQPLRNLTRFKDAPPVVEWEVYPIPKEWRKMDSWNQADNKKKPFKKRWMSTNDAAVFLSMTQQLPPHVQQPTTMTCKATTSVTEHQIELMRWARSRVLEDAVSASAALSSSCSNTNNHNTTMILPYTLAKYSDIYNQNGRVGIYTPNERAAIIAKFHQKRSKRVWDKKIRYTCRKNLEDWRLRVKGRFVKRDSHFQSSNGAVNLASVNENATTTSVGVLPMLPVFRQFACFFNAAAGQYTKERWF